MDKELQHTIWKYYLFSFLSNFWFLSAILIPFFTQWGHISLFQVQVLQSWYSICFFLLDVPTGIVADKFGRKYTLATGTILSGIGLITYAIQPNFLLFLLAEFIVALGNSLISGANNALLYEKLKEKGVEQDSKKYFGKANSYQLLGVFLGSMLGGIFASLYGLNAPLFFSAIPSFLAAIVAWTFKESHTHKEHVEKEHVLQTLRNGYSYLLTHKTLRLLVLDTIMVACAGYFVVWLYQPLLINLGVKIAYFGIFSSILVGSEILVSHNFSFLERITGSARRYLKFSALATGLSFLVLAIFPNIVTILIFLLIAGGLGITRDTLMSSYMQQFIPSEKRATVLSSISTFKRVLIALVNPLIGFLATTSIPLALILLACLPLAIFFLSPIQDEMLTHVQLKTTGK